MYYTVGHILQFHLNNMLDLYVKWKCPLHLNVILKFSFKKFVYSCNHDTYFRHLPKHPWPQLFQTGNFWFWIRQLKCHLVNKSTFYKRCIPKPLITILRPPTIIPKKFYKPDLVLFGVPLYYAAVCLQLKLGKQITKSFTT